MRIRITIACPEKLIEDANDLSMVLGLGPADANTFKSAEWSDADQHRYAAASFTVEENWITAAQSTLVRPTWDDLENINMAAAERAQGKLVFLMPTHEGDAPQANPDKLVAIGGVDGREALALMQLSSGILEENDLFDDTLEDESIID